MNRESLLVFHSHWRVGGVRSVIETTLPAILQTTDIRRLVLLSGEAAPEEWIQRMRAICRRIAVEELVEPTFGYVSEMRHPPMRGSLRETWRKIITQYGAAAIWCHNPGLGRNVPAVEDLITLAGECGVPVILHHHDLWCDHRWNRWKEMQACGYRKVEEVARALFSCPDGVAHVTINSRDFDLFHQAHASRSWKLGNPFDPPTPLAEKEIEHARAWLRKTTGCKESSPIWLAPARLLRRKNLIESLVLMLQLQPDATLLTSNQIGSRDEEAYAARLQELSRRWPGRLVLTNLNAPGAPSLYAMQMAADVLVQSSMQEGFGLIFPLAAWGGCTLVCRKLANVWRDLEERGMALPMAYEELYVELGQKQFFEEQQRQKTAVARLRATVPETWRAKVTDALFLPWFDSPKHVAFSRLSIEGQSSTVENALEHGLARREFAPKASHMVAGAAACTTSNYAEKFKQILMATRDSLKNAAAPDFAAAESLQERIARDALMAENFYQQLVP